MAHIIISVSYTHLHIDKIKRLIPKIKVCLLAKAGGQQDFLFLPAAEIFHILFKLNAGKIQLAQDGQKQAFANLLFFCIAKQIAL